MTGLTFRCDRDAGSDDQALGHRCRTHTDNGSHGGLTDVFGICPPFLTSCPHIVSPSLRPPGPRPPSTLANHTLALLGSGLRRAIPDAVCYKPFAIVLVSWVTFEQRVPCLHIPFIFPTVTGKYRFPSRNVWCEAILVSIQSSEPCESAIQDSDDHEISIPKLITVEHVAPYQSKRDP